MHNIRPRAKCGPRKLFTWPAKSNILILRHVSFIKHLFMCKTCKFLPLNMSKNFFWPTFRLELCIHGLSSAADQSLILWDRFCLWTYQDLHLATQNKTVWDFHNYNYYTGTGRRRPSLYARDGDQKNYARM